MAFGLTVTQHKRADVIEVSGRIDSSTSPQFEAAVQKLIDDGHTHLVIDLAKTEYMSSAAFRVLISAHKQVHKGTRRGDIRISGASPKLVETFKLGGFDELFKFYNSQVDAVGSF